MPTFLLVVLMVTAAGCSLTPRPVETALDETADDRCSRAVAAFRNDPGDAAVALEAAHLLFATADLRVQQALVEATRVLEADDPSTILAAEAELPATVRDDVLALATTGSEAAQAALDAMAKAAVADGDPLRTDANVHLALHLTFVAWANGPVRSLMAGYASRIIAATDAALAADPAWDDGAPLRLKGRFLSKAPWPVGDSKEALSLLQRAIEIAPLPIHHLFLGDHLQQRGDREAAIAEWQAVLTSQPDATTQAVAPLHREMAMLRLRAAGR